MIEIREKQKETFLKAEAEQEAMVEELEELEVALKKQMQSFAQTPEPVLLEESAAPAATQGDYDAFVQISHRHHRKKEVNFATLDASGIPEEYQDLATRWCFHPGWSGSRGSPASQ